LSLAGPPDGFYIKGTLQNNSGSTKIVDFEGGDAEVTMTMPPITGPLIAVSGICLKPDGSPAAAASVHSMAAGDFITSGAMSYTQPHRADGRGRFTLDGIPAGQALLVYAETENRDFAGTAVLQIPREAEPGFRPKISLRRAVEVDVEMVDSQGKPFPARTFHISPRVE
jgi:hypothetical protein